MASDRVTSNGILEALTYRFNENSVDILRVAIVAIRYMVSREVGYCF